MAGRAGRGEGRGGSHLGDDGLDVDAAGEVLLEGIKLQGLLRHDDVLATGVAGSAVAREDGLTSGSVTSERGGGEGEGGGGGGGDDLGVDLEGGRGLEGEGRDSEAQHFF